MIFGATTPGERQGVEGELTWQPPVCLSQEPRTISLGTKVVREKHPDVLPPCLGWRAGGRLACRRLAARRISPSDKKAGYEALRI